MLRKPFSRRDFLRAAAVSAAAVGAGCRPESQDEEGTSSSTGQASGGKDALKILQWSHFVPAYDDWFDKEYTQQWGEENGVEVVVDHIDFAQIPARAAAEVSAQSGHDLFWFLSAPAAYEDEVIDHSDIVKEIEGKVGGKMIGVCERSTFNPKTKKFFGFADNWVPDPVHYRIDLWEETGYTPETWDDVLAAAPKLKAMGNPLGLGISQDIDANMALIALMQCFGSYIQDEEANVTLNSPETVEAVSFGAELYKQGMTSEVFAWDASSNNRFFESGKGSMVMNAISVLRTLEDANPELAADTGIALIPEGPVQRLGLEHVLGVYVIWKFSKKKDLASKFLVDLAVNYRDAFVESKFYNFPSFPDSVPNLTELISDDPVSQPPDKLAILADAEKISTNVGHPGTVNAAIDELFNQYLIPQMFAQAAREELTPEEAVKAADGQIKDIFAKWRDQGKI